MYMYTTLLLVASLNLYDESGADFKFILSWLTMMCYLKSTSRHIFENVLVCIERGLYSVFSKEMNLFENVI